LFELATSQKVLRRAWETVRPRVRNSDRPEVRQAVAAFERDLHGEIRKLQMELRKGTFLFERQRGVAKRKKGEPGKIRPIVVAPVRNRIIQRAILDVCQMQDAAVRKHLGEIPNVVNSAQSFGGLPGRAVPQAIDAVQAAISEGKLHYVRSDLKKFFVNIPKPLIRKFLNASISDKQFVQLFMDALETELDNEDEVREWLRFFPTEDKGIPQGSALSALCANIVLLDFDRRMSGRSIVTIRYLDDFVILGPSELKVSKAWVSATKLLAAVNLECHDPADRKADKAGKGHADSGFAFLGYFISRSQVRPTDKACEAIVKEVEKILRGSRRHGMKADDTADTKPFAIALGLISLKVKSWADAFNRTTDRLAFARVDDRIDQLLNDHFAWIERKRQKFNARSFRTLLGVAAASEAKPFSVKSGRSRPVRVSSPSD
jgi:retron-type reverse transcriptase